MDLKQTLLLVHYVHCNFKAKAHFFCYWFSPHNVSPFIEIYANSSWES